MKYVLDKKEERALADALKKRREVEQANEMIMWYAGQVKAGNLSQQEARIMSASPIAKINQWDRKHAGVRGVNFAPLNTFKMYRDCRDN